MRRAPFILGLLTATVALADWPDLSKPPPPVGGGEKDAALVVGVESYLALPQVSGAVQNATEWYLYLANGLKVPPSSLTLLRNNEASLEKLKKYAALAAGQVKPGGTLWFIFIGHGAPAKDGKDGVLVGFDAQQDADSLYARSLAQGELQGLLSKGAQARTVVLLDACFSGRAGGGAPLVPGLQPVIPILSRPEAKGAPTLILSAGQNDQFAGPLPGVARPAFSYLLLGALRGWGDANKDGLVDAREAVDYATVALTSTVKDRTQTPQLTGPNASLSRSGKELAPNLAELVVMKPAVGGTAPVAVTAAATTATPTTATVQVVTQTPAQGTPALAAPTESQPVTVAVAELKGRLPPELQWLGASISDAILTRLQRSKSVRVVEPEFLDQLTRQFQLQSSAAIDPTMAVKVGKVLGAKVFVTGSVAQIDQQLVVRARLVSVDRGDTLGDPIEVTGVPTKLSALETDVAKAVGRGLALELPQADSTGLDASEIAFEAYGDLEQARRLSAGLPLFGLDPSRRSKAMQWQMGLGYVARLQTAYPKLGPVRLAHARFALQQEDLDTAAFEADQARALSPNDVEPLLVAANVAASRRDLKTAYAFAADAAKRFPDDARGWYLLGRIQLQNGDKHGAALSLLLSLERNPRVKEADTNLQTALGGADGPRVVASLGDQPRYLAAAAAYAALFKDDVSRAGPYAMESLRSTPALPIGHLVMGMIERRQGNLGRAEQLLAQALSLRPDMAQIHTELAEVLLSQRRCEEARLHASLFASKAVVIRTADANDLESRLASCR